MNYPRPPAGQVWENRTKRYAGRRVRLVRVEGQQITLHHAFSDIVTVTTLGHLLKDYRPADEATS